MAFITDEIKNVKNAKDRLPANIVFPIDFTDIALIIEVSMLVAIQKYKIFNHDWKVTAGKKWLIITNSIYLIIILIIYFKITPPTIYYSTN